MKKDSEHRKSASLLKERVKIMKMKESCSQERATNQKRAYESVINALQKNQETKLKKRTKKVPKQDDSSLGERQIKALASIRSQIAERDKSIEKL